MTHVKESLVKNAPPDDQVRVAAETLILSPAEAKYLLSRLATAMQTGTKEIKLDEANLDHIFPKSPGDEWKKNKDELEEYLWHMANLTMLGERLNRNAANRGYPLKRSEYYQKSELEMARQIAKDYAAWDKHTIEDRAKRLAPQVAKVWNFDNPSRVQSLIVFGGVSLVAFATTARQTAKSARKRTPLDGTARQDLNATALERKGRAVSYKLVKIEQEDSARPASGWQWVENYEVPEAVMAFQSVSLSPRQSKSLRLRRILAMSVRNKVQVSGIIWIPKSAIHMRSHLT